MGLAIYISPAWAIYLICLFSLLSQHILQLLVYFAPNFHVALGDVNIPSVLPGADVRVVNCWYL